MDLTLRNLPAHVLEDLERAARLNGRSVNDEAIARLAQAPPASLNGAAPGGSVQTGRDDEPRERPTVEQLLAEIRELRARYPLPYVTPEELRAMIEEGRA